MYFKRRGEKDVTKSIQAARKSYYGKNRDCCRTYNIYDNGIHTCCKSKLIKRCGYGSGGCAYGNSHRLSHRYVLYGGFLKLSFCTCAGYGIKRLFCFFNAKPFRLSVRDHEDAFANSQFEFQSVPVQTDGFLFSADVTDRVAETVRGIETEGDRIGKTGGRIVIVDD